MKLNPNAKVEKLQKLAQVSEAIRFLLEFYQGKQPQRELSAEVGDSERGENTRRSDSYAGTSATFENSRTEVAEAMSGGYSDGN